MSEDGIIGGVAVTERRQGPGRSFKRDQAMVSNTRQKPDISVMAVRRVQSAAKLVGKKPLKRTQDVQYLLRYKSVEINDK